MFKLYIFQNGYNWSNMHPVSNVIKVDLAALDPVSSLNAGPNVNHTAAKQITQLKYLE